MANKEFDAYVSNPNNSLNYLQKISSRTLSIYNFVIITLFAAIALLPFISLDIFASSPASIESNYLKETIYIPASGKLSFLNVENNKPIFKGDTILAIDNSLLRDEIAINEKKKLVVEQSLHDIEMLQKNHSANNIGVLYTPQYQSQYSHFLEENAALKAKLEKVSKVYHRSQTIFHEKLIAPEEFEQYELEFNQATADLKLLETQTLAKWRTEQFQLYQELNNLKIREHELRQAVKNSVVTAHVSGIGYKESGIQPGGFVQSGQRVAEIVPDSFLIALCYVSPKDIGFIKTGQSVKLQLDAFNYYEWGMVDGKVFEIAKDVTIVQNQPLYMVKCRLNKKFLSLKNGYRGTIMKGMTAKANFHLTNRTLWQLIFTSINDWLNPKAY